MKNFTNITSIELFNENKKTTAALSKFSLFAIRTYISECVELFNTLNSEPITAPNVREFKTVATAVAYCENNGFVKTNGTNSDNSAKNELNAKRKADTIASIVALCTTSDRAILTADNKPSVQFVYSHNNSRCAVKIFNERANDYKTAFTLFIQTSHCNLTVRESTLADILDYAPTNADYMPNVTAHGSLSYGAQSVFIKELEYNTPEVVTAVRDKNGEPKYSKNGALVLATKDTPNECKCEVTLFHNSSLYNLVEFLLTMYGAISELEEKPNEEIENEKAATTAKTEKKK